jgi:hypothetical protein
LTTAQSVAALERVVSELRGVICFQHETRLEALEEKMRQTQEGLGGAVWRTQQGHARFIALLSTQHLKNILAWPRVSDRIKNLVEAELGRREVDAQFRKEECSNTFQGPLKVALFSHGIPCDPAPLSVSERIDLLMKQVDKLTRAIGQLPR